MYPTHCVKLAEQVRILACSPQTFVIEMLICCAGGVSRNRQSMCGIGKEAGAAAAPATMRVERDKRRGILLLELYLGSSMNMDQCEDEDTTLWKMLVKTGVILILSRSITSLVISKLNCRFSIK